jgi:hypothetical protein
MTDHQQKLMIATDLLQQCADGFGAFVNGRKMARKDRDALRTAIATFLDGVAPKSPANGKPATEYGQCETCGMFSSAAKALHDAKGR